MAHRHAFERRRNLAPPCPFFVRQQRALSRHEPISPEPVTGGMKDELPAYLSNGVVGLRIRDNPPTAGMAMVSGLVGRHPVRHIEAAALAPYPLALDISLDEVWLSKAPQAMSYHDRQDGERDAAGPIRSTAGPDRSRPGAERGASAPLPSAAHFATFILGFVIPCMATGALIVTTTIVLTKIYLS
jgi:hypothetical protein